MAACGKKCALRLKSGPKPNKKLHADTYFYDRFCVFRGAQFYTKTLSEICAGELGVRASTGSQNEIDWQAKIRV